MKKSTFILLVMGFVLVAGTVYALMNRPPAEDLSRTERVLQILDKGGCLDCHSAEPNLPFYFKMPVADKIMKQDIDSGFRAFDIEPLMNALAKNERPSMVDVAKVEKSPLKSVCLWRNTIWYTGAAR